MHISGVYTAYSLFYRHTVMSTAADWASSLVEFQQLHETNFSTADGFNWHECPKSHSNRK